MTTRLMITLAAVALLLPLEATSQKVTYRRPISRPTTRVDGIDASVSQGPTQRLPRNYNRYYYSRTGGYAVTPLVVPQPFFNQPTFVGGFRPYTDEQYAQIVLDSLTATSIQPVEARVPTRSLVVEVEGTGKYKRVEATIADVLDRGILLANTREEIRLRGARLMSENDPNDIVRYYAREAIGTLRDLTRDLKVYIEFGQPLRDSDGTLLGTVYLSDGTELNRLVLQRGYGQLVAEDFMDGADYSSLVEAEQAARAAKLGIWSRME